MLPRPPTSPLFPYTTLFRSVVVLATAVREVRTAVEAIKRGAYDYITKPFDVEDIELLVRRALDKRALEREVLYLRSTDRKSTRLNSSHEWISYAVFCLKKKT